MGNGPAHHASIRAMPAPEAERRAIFLRRIGEHRAAFRPKSSIPLMNPATKTAVRVAVNSGRAVQLFNGNPGS